MWRYQYKSIENNNYNTFYESVTLSGFMPHITLSRRLSDTGDTLIDNIFTQTLYLPE